MSGSVGLSKSTELEALRLREQKIKPYLTMLEEIMATVPERAEIAGQLYRLVIMTKTENLDAAARVHEYMAKERKPQLVYVQPPPAERVR